MKHTRRPYSVTARLGLLALGLLLLSGCTARPAINGRLDHYAPNQGYRYESTRPGPDNSDSLLVILTFSGGGTRAAALAYGTLEALRDTTIEWEGRTRRLIDEVDAISSVSGGSLPAGYYALFGDRIFEDFPDKVLYKDIQGNIIKQVLAVRNYARLMSPFFSRTNLMAEDFDESIFEGKTFGDLAARGNRPFLIMNATNMHQGSRFEFTQEQFDLLYSDLSKYPVGYAAAASAAFPGLLTPIVVRNHEEGRDYELPLWVRETLAAGDPGRYGYQLAEEMLAYVEHEQPYVHLVDGGVSDNLGLVPVILGMQGGITTAALWPAFTSGQVKKVVIITVNAKKGHEGEQELTAKIAGLFQVLDSATGTPLETFSQAQIEYLKLLIYTLRRDPQSIWDFRGSMHGGARGAMLGPVRPVDYHFIEVAFNRHDNAEERRYLNSLPTSFRLKTEQVDRLRAAARDILGTHPAFQDLLEELRAEAEGKAPAEE
ncbi:MAG: patatin-like phospholipase family protein [Candidatus Hydrogenedens sp.]|nr:patatin-like phospholipase family protein [Candidatus Hydrogenedentota bacterium]NLF57528.1 patatin-like phospholipase family protein [Candidatus Hydrogenedens sp.]